jgi:muconate cycloisomerase
MTIVAADVTSLALPFRFEFRHARASRAQGASVLVRLADDEGREGWGEGAPREYVTGETVEGARRLLEDAFVPSVLGLRVDSLLAAEETSAALRASAPSGANAALCAMELALLDLGGRAEGGSAGRALGPVLRPEVRYGAVVSSGTTEEAVVVCRKAREFGFEDFKVKVGGRADAEIDLLGAVRDAIGPSSTLRIDANGSWPSREDALRRLESMRDLGVAAAEEPLAPGDVPGLQWLTARSPVPIVADESLASLDDARRLAERRACHVFNVRVSKLGGIRESARVVAIARDSGTDWMLGAHVGESALLSAAGRHVATRCPGGRWFEGSYGTLLLEEDLGDATVRAGGVGAALTGPGLGVDVSSAVVARRSLAAAKIGATS